MNLASRRLNLFLVILGTFIFHSVCRIWISWYLLAVAVAIPLLSVGVSLLAMLRAVPSVEMNEYLRHQQKEYIRCCCTSRSRLFGYPPRCVLVVRVTYLSSGHSSDYEANLSAGEPMFIRLNTVHCTAVRAECVKAYVLDYLGVFKLRIEKPPMLDGVIMPAPVSDSDRVEKTVVPESEKTVSSSPERSHELYELREYREGDILRDIHWKMTAKTGRIIVREAERIESEKTAVVLDIMENMSDNDRMMELALGVSLELLDSGRAHSFFWYDRQETLCRADVNDRASQLKAFGRMLADSPPESGASTSGTEPDGFDVILHITPGEADDK